MSLHKDAADGKLTKPLLNDHLRSSKIDDISTNTSDGTKGFTPLAIAAMNGHVNVVGLLLDNNANPDRFSTFHRTPLWIVTARGGGDGRPEIVDMLLKKKANPDATHPDLDNQTPLLNELHQRKDPEVIKSLVDYNASTKEAQAVADQLNDPRISDAMLRKWQRSKIRTEIVGLITQLILFIIAWVNSPTVQGIVKGVAKKVYDITGDKTSKESEAISKVSRER